MAKKSTSKPKERVAVKAAAFLAAIRVYPSITAAAHAAGISRESHYRNLERSGKYRTAFDRAYKQGIQALEDEAVRRALSGVQRPVLYHGKPVTVPIDPAKPRGKRQVLMETEYSDTLMQMLLKAKKPDEYRERVTQEVSGPGGGPIDNKLEIVFVRAKPADPAPDAS